MIKIEFGIIENIQRDKDYSSYEPEKYNCIVIDDELYMNDWWQRLMLIKTYFHNLNTHNYGLDRWGGL